MYCHRFPTLACVTGNGRVRSPEDNKAPLTVSEISSVREDKAKTVSLLRWEEAERMVSVTYVNHFKPRYFGAAEKTTCAVVKNDKGYRCQVRMPVTRSCFPTRKSG